MTAQLDMFASIVDVAVPARPAVVASFQAGAIKTPLSARLPRGLVQGPVREDRFDVERGYAVATCQDCLTEIRLASWRGVRFFIEPDEISRSAALRRPDSRRFNGRARCGRPLSYRPDRWQIFRPES